MHILIEKLVKIYNENYNENYSEITTVERVWVWHSLDDLTRVSRYPWNRITDAIKLLQGYWHLCRLDYVQSRHTSLLEKDRVNLIPTSGSPLSWVRIQKQSNKTLPFWGENSPVPISYRMPRITCEPQLPIPQNVEHVKTSNTKHFQIPWSTMCNKQDPIWVHNLSCWVFIHSTANDDKDPSSFKQPQFSDSDQSKSPLKHPRPFAVIVFGLCHHPRLSLTSSTSQL